MILATLLLLVFFLVSMLFGILSGKQVCAICVSVGLTWLTLLFFARGSVDPIVIGILMGESAVGTMYYLSSKLPDKYQILKFPFLVSLFWIVFRVLKGAEGIPNRELALLGVVWLLFLTVFLFSRNNHLREIAGRLIECCRNW